MDKLPQDRKHGAIEPVKAEIVRMTAVHGTGVTLFGAEKRFAVKEPYEPVSRAERPVVCPSDDFTAPGIAFGSPEITFGYEQDRQVGPPAPDCLKKRSMSRLKMSRIRGIVIIIEYGAGERKPPDCFGQRDFSFAAAGKTEVQLFRIQRPA